MNINPRQGECTAQKEGEEAPTREKKEIALPPLGGRKPGAGRRVGWSWERRKNGPSSPPKERTRTLRWGQTDEGSTGTRCIYAREK